MHRYLYESPDWPHLGWDATLVLPSLQRIRHRRDCLIGEMASRRASFQEAIQLDALTREIVCSSAIEGEQLPEPQVRSAVAWLLGLNRHGLPAPSHDVSAAARVVLDATHGTNFDTPLTAERLFTWHGALFQSGYSGGRRVRVGTWRDDADGPMQVVSGPRDNPTVHFEAPAAARVPGEMQQFLAWFNAQDTEGYQDAIVRAALAHLWFVTIHPFDDGNGRIARAITNRALAQADHCPQRWYSLSAQIYADRQLYYDVLEMTQRGSPTDVTRWVAWFLECQERALAAAETFIAVARQGTRHGVL